jgi:hypothetical protein
MIMQRRRALWHNESSNRLSPRVVRVPNFMRTTCIQALCLDYEMQGHLLYTGRMYGSIALCTNAM